MEKRSFAKNYFFELLSQLAVLALPLVTTPYLSRVLGAKAIGRYSFAGSIVSYFALLAALGTTLYGQRLIARVHNSPKVRTHFFVEVALLRAITVAIVFGAYFLLVLPHAANPLLYAAAGIEIIAVALDISWFYRGMENFGPVTLTTAVGRLAAAVCVFTLVKTREDLVLYVVIYGASILLGDLLLWLDLRKYLVRVRRWRPKLGGHFLLSLGLFVSGLSIHVYTVLDKTMIGLITRRAAQNGYYEQGQKLIRVLVTLVTVMGAVAASRAAVLWKEKKTDELRDLLMGSFRLCFALGLPLAAGIALVASRFTPIFYGAGYRPVAAILCVLAPIIPLVGASNVIGIQFFAATGREKRLTISVAIGALCNILLNLWLIFRYAALGAAIASVAAELIVTLTQCVMARRELPLFRVFLLFCRYLGFTAIMAAVGLVLSLTLGKGPAALAVIVVACAALYAALLLAFRDPVRSIFTAKGAR